MFGALNTIKKMPNYEKNYLKFNFKEVGKEARSAARSLARSEEKPSLLNREALRDFSFSNYFDNLAKIAPTLTTTLIAASSQSKFRDTKVHLVHSTVQCTVGYLSLKLSNLTPLKWHW